MTVQIGEKNLRKANPRVVFPVVALTTSILVIMYILLTWSVGFTSSVNFCTANCHEMAVSFREWQTSSHYDNDTGVVAECADCHLPRGFVPQIKAKLYFGIRDTLVHHFGDPDGLDRKRLAGLASANITDDSCMACHKNLLPSGLPRGGFLAHSRILDGERVKCVGCHRQMVHQNRIYFGKSAREAAL